MQIDNQKKRQEETVHSPPICRSLLALSVTHEWLTISYYSSCHRRRTENWNGHE